MGEIISQAKFFADFGATPGGSGGGNRLLTKVKSVDTKDDRDVEVVMASGVSGGAGFRRKQGGGELSLTVYRETGPNPEVDWEKLRDDEKIFTFIVADEQAGKRRSYRCTVAKIDAKDDEAGVHEDTVTLKYTQRYT